MRYLGRIRCSKSDEFDKRKALIKEKTDEFKTGNRLYFRNGSLPGKVL
jgi:hypothetical protein